MEASDRTSVAAARTAGGQAWDASAYARLGPELRDAEGRWTADYTRLRFRARLETPSRKPTF